MNSHDKLVKLVTKSLDQTAKAHPQQQAIIDAVQLKLKQPKSTIRPWAMGGFALAAALSGILIVPDFIAHSSHRLDADAVNQVRLSPQMVEDMEMLSLLGTTSQGTSVGNNHAS